MCVSQTVPPSGFFFLFIHYSYATYLDHDKGRSPYVQSVSCPQSAQWRLETERLGAEVEEPLFLPTPAFLASAEEE